MFGDLDFMTLRDLGIAVAIGALIGVERERKADDLQFGGIRTFTLLAVAGAISAWLAVRLQLPSLFVVGAISVTLLLAVSYGAAAQKSASLPGLTTEIAGLIAFLLGGASAAGFPEIAVPLGIVTAGVLALKDPLHDLVERIGKDDIAAALQLLFATFIVLPLLPNEALDPWQSLNPYKLWWLVILISGLSLLGYVAVRWLGPGRGLALTGLFGGLVSSTAVSLSFAERSKEDPSLEDALAGGVLLAWGVMFVRVIVEVAVVNPSLTGSVAIPMAAMAVASLLAVFWFTTRSPAGEKPREEATPDQDDVKLKNPFSLWSAVKFGAFFALVLLFVAIVKNYVSEEWLYLVAAVAGSTDVDAITLSLADAANNNLTPIVAVWGILIAAASNTLVKFGLIVAGGSKGLRRRMGLATALILVTGAGSVLVQLAL